MEIDNNLNFINMLITRALKVTTGRYMDLDSHQQYNVKKERNNPFSTRH